MRAYYDYVPNKEKRRAYARNEDMKKKMKQYFRKYQHREDWDDHKLSDFEVKQKRRFHYIREAAKVLLERLGFSLYTPTSHPDGTVSLTRYMALLQKVSSLIQAYLKITYADSRGVQNLTMRYDWKKDPKKINQYFRGAENEVFNNWLIDNDVLEHIAVGPMSRNILAGIKVAAAETNLVISTNEDNSIKLTKEGKWEIIDPEIPIQEGREALYKTYLSQFEADPTWDTEHVAFDEPVSTLVFDERRLKQSKDLYAPTSRARRVVVPSTKAPIELADFEKKKKLMSLESQ
jgi:hypothetical protein